jgi:hypothetical protein
VNAGDIGAGVADSVAGVVAKLTGAFLDSRWTWPRRHGRVGQSAFLLADPRALEFEPDELRALASELQAKLFGVEGEGEVCLLLFEGAQEEIMRFATCSDAALKAALEGDDDALSLSGRIRRVTAAGIESVAHPGDPENHVAVAEPEVTSEELIERLRQPDSAASGSPSATAPTVGFHAVFHAPRGTVIGSAVSDGRIGASSLRGIFANAGHLQGAAARRYDAHCLDAALPTMVRPFSGLLFLPISFSSIVHRPTRETYLPMLEQLPRARRGQLATSVYDVPRDPSFTAMSQVAAFLKTYFGFIDLGVTDPGFRVEKLAAGVVNSVTLLITETDAKTRLASVRRFMDNRENYKRQKIWPAVSHIRNRAELDFCTAQRAPFLSGPAVSDMLETPAESAAIGIGDMPLRRDYVPATKVA